MNKLIVFEGGDGSGKTTAAQKASVFLNDRGIKTIYTRQPGGTELGLKIRDLILSNRMSAMTELLLFLADRNAHLEQITKDLVNTNIICDRWDVSTIVYQGIARGVLDLEFVKQMNSMVVGNFTYDQMFIFSCDPVQAMNRITRMGKGNRIDNESLEFHRKVNEAYLEYFYSNYQIKKELIDTTHNTEDQTFEHVKDLLIELESLGFFDPNKEFDPF